MTIPCVIEILDHFVAVTNHLSRYSLTRKTRFYNHSSQRYGVFRIKGRVDNCGVFVHDHVPDDAGKAPHSIQHGSKIHGKKRVMQQTGRVQHPLQACLRAILYKRDGQTPYLSKARSCQNVFLFHQIQCIHELHLRVKPTRTRHTRRDPGPFAFSAAISLATPKQANVYSLHMNRTVTKAVASIGGTPVARKAQMIDVREQPAAVIKVHISTPL